jgi:hypothetical protein
MNQKALTDSLRVLVKPTTPQQQKQVRAREERSMSPFRTLKPSSNGAQLSPRRRRDEKNDLDPKFQLHQSEINIFKQLCLDKHDENAAIEILLDSPESSIPELYTASSESTDHGSRSFARKKTGSVEGKRKFLDRLFFKSQRKSSTQFFSSANFLDSAKENTIAMSHLSNVSDEPTIPCPPSSTPTTRISVESTFPDTSNITWAEPFEKKSSINQNVSRTKSILDDIHEFGDATSNISSLSGTRTSSLITPVTFNRHESLGFESIKDIRKCLKEMERQLGQATHKGQRVSRQKVMRALFTVADSLEDEDEKSYLKKELRTSAEMEKEVNKPVVATKALKLDSSDDDKSELTTSDDDDFTLDSATFEEIDEDKGTNESPFNFVSSVGNFFGVDTKNQNAVEEVLDDLLWTEFVSSRQRNTNEKENSGTHFQPKNISERGRKVSLHVKDYEESHNEKDQRSRPRSWWRNHPSIEEDDYSSSSSEDEFTTYLPTSITVKKRRKKPTELDNAFPRSLTNPHYKVKLVDTESRLGYEMDHTSRRSRVL